MASRYTRAAPAKEAAEAIGATLVAAMKGDKADVVVDGKARKP